MTPAWADTALAHPAGWSWPSTTGRKAGEGHLVPGHQPAHPRHLTPPPARTRRPTSPRSSASTACGRRSSRATNRSRTNSAGPNSKSAPTEPSNHWSQQKEKAQLTRVWWRRRPTRTAGYHRAGPVPAPTRGQRGGPAPCHQPCCPRALRAIRSWLTAAVTLNRWWRAWTDKDPPSELQALIDAVTAGHGIDLYCRI